MFDRLRSLSMRQQVLLVAGLVAATCFLFVAIWVLFFRVTYQPLFTQLRPTDAGAIAADLDRKKIPYRLADGGATILVPEDIVDRTRLDVMTEDVPLKGTVGFELFDKSDMGLTDFAQKINYQRALQGELERTISTLDGVDSARVHLSLGEDRIFRDDRVPPKASVTIRMQKGSVLSASSAQGIQRLIAAAVPNLETANVVILDNNGRVVGPAASPRTDEDILQPLEQEKRAIEQYYQARARLALERAYPLGAFGVDVSADMQGQPAAQPETGASAPDWTAATRSFPLKVTIVPSAMLDSAARDNVRSLVAAAVGFDPAKSDTIEFGSTPDQTLAPAITAPKKISAPARGADDSSSLPTVDSVQPLLTVLLFLLLFGIACAVLWRLRRPKRLTEAQRTQLAAKFRSLLEQGDRHVTP